MHDELFSRPREPKLNRRNTTKRLWKTCLIHTSYRFNIFFYMSMGLCVYSVYHLLLARTAFYIIIICYELSPNMTATNNNTHQNNFAEYIWLCSVCAVLIVLHEAKKRRANITSAIGFYKCNLKLNIDADPMQRSVWSIAVATMKQQRGGQTWIENRKFII